MNKDTIAAIATPVGNGGIGIIRISGPSAINIANSVFRRYKSRQDPPAHKSLGNEYLGIDPNKKSRRIYYGHITDPKDGRILDEVLIMVMPSPKTYTREDVVEINTHSGIVVLNAVLELILDRGARLAEPGEFTKRAFLNGRIDLTQAEAVIDLINAKTTRSLELAVNQMQGGMGREIDDILEALQDIIVEGEAEIDFPEDVGDIFEKENIKNRLIQQVATPLKNLINQHNRTQLLRSGIKTVIVGRPNVGKSSLMNCLVKTDRVIVSEVPGTTRDFIEEAQIISNMPIIFTDTAGLHDSEDQIENVGIKKTYEYIKKADLVLFVIDISRSLNEDDMLIYENIKHKKIVLVMNKSDIAKENNIDILDLPWKIKNYVKTSALLEQGIDALEKEIVDAAIQYQENGLPECRLSPNLRQKKALERTLESVLAAIDGITSDLSAEFVLIDLKDGFTALEEVVGKSVSSDILDNIFSQFCIGK